MVTHLERQYLKQPMQYRDNNRRNKQNRVGLDQHALHLVDLSRRRSRLLVEAIGHRGVEVELEVGERMERYCRTVSSIR